MSEQRDSKSIVTEFNVIGGGWVLPGNYGRMRSGILPPLVPGDIELPPPHSVFSRPPTRFRRFDPFTRLGCMAMALSLKDTGLDFQAKQNSVGIIVSSIYDCIETDIAFYDTIREGDGLYASPNLFSYTLPGIVIGETAIQFGLTGPTLTVGDAIDARGYSALKTATELVGNGLSDTMVAGWVDCETALLKRSIAGDNGIRGAIFVVLSSRYPQRSLKQIVEREGRLYNASGARILTIADLFAR